MHAAIDRRIGHKPYTRQRNGWRRTAAQLGLTEEDINAEIKAMRAQKRK